VFVFANPVSVYCLSTFFHNEAAGSIAIRVIYVVLGCVIPLLIIVLLNFQKTVDLGLSLRWLFMPFPIFSLVFGVIVISE
jgi:hypothetical protein